MTVPLRVDWVPISKEKVWTFEEERAEEEVALIAEEDHCYYASPPAHEDLGLDEYLNWYAKTHLICAGYPALLRVDPV